MQGLIIGGNEGTRLRPLTIYTPKPVIQIVDRPFLSYQLDNLKSLNISDVILTIGYQSNKIEDIFGNGLERGIQLKYITESSPLGTAGTIRHAQADIGETLVVINGDVLTDIDLTGAVEFHKEKGSMMTVILTPEGTASAFGIIELDSDGRVTTIHEKHRSDDHGLHSYSAGIYIIEPSALKLIPEGEKHSLEFQLIPKLVESGHPVFACPSHGHWIEFDTPQKYLQANIDMICGLIGTTEIERPRAELPAPEGEAAQIDRNSYIHPDTIIKPGAVILNSVISANCHIEERARIEYSVLLPGARVGKSTEVRGAIIGKGVIIGRFARIHSTVLGDKSSLTDYSII